MRNDERGGANRGRSERGGPSRRGCGEGRSGSPRVGAIYSGVPAARRADAEGDERPAEYRGNGYRSERREPGYAKRNRDFAASEGAGRNGARSDRRESASARAYERGDVGSACQGREANHARRGEDARDFGASRSGGAADRQWSGEARREFTEAHRQWQPMERAEEDSTFAAEGHGRESSVPPEENENLLAGRNPIREALKSGRSVEKLLVARGDLSGAARDIVRMAREAGAVVQEVDRSRLDQIYPAHQGLLACVAAVDYASVDDLFARAQERGEDPFFILLDGVTDPHNLGAILRTAECAGAHGAILPERRSAGLGPAAAKAAAGALDCLPVARVKNLNRTIDELKQRGVWIIGTAMDGEDALTADLTGPVALVIGSEGEGVSRLTLQKCDRTLTLPMRGRIESLNASVAAGILMYEVVRARAR